MASSILCGKKKPLRKSASNSNVPPTASLMTGPYENYKNDDEASEKNKNKDKTKSKSKEKKQSAEDLALNSPIPGQEKKAVVMDETQKKNQHQNQNHNNVEPEAWYKHVKNSQTFTNKVFISVSWLNFLLRKENLRQGSRYQFVFCSQYKKTAGIRIVRELPGALPKKKITQRTSAGRRRASGSMRTESGRDPKNLTPSASSLAQF